MLLQVTVLETDRVGARTERIGVDDDVEIYGRCG